MSVLIGITALPPADMVLGIKKCLSPGSKDCSLRAKNVSSLLVANCSFSKKVNSTLGGISISAPRNSAEKIEFA